MSFFDRIPTTLALGTLTALQIAPLAAEPSSKASPGIRV